LDFVVQTVPAGKAQWLPIRDLLRQLAVADIVQVRWTADIHREWIDAHYLMSRISSGQCWSFLNVISSSFQLIALFLG
jgi:hypothetical protein